MTKPALFRAIYHELRGTLGPTATAGEVLKLANLLLRAYVDDLPADADPSYEGRVGSKPFSSLPVDEAMRDGGWRILEFETRLMLPSRDRDISSMTKLRPLIQKYLGPEWQHPTLTTDRLSP